MNRNIHTVTGAFGYTGGYVARKLIERGEVVETLTNSPHKQEQNSVLVNAVHPLNFKNEGSLVEALQSTKVLYNTYWVRFNHSWFNHGEAVENTFKLFDAAKKAGVERVVHVSITKADKDSSLDYFRGKGEIEEYLKNLGVSYTIVRPAVLFGGEDILLNNIAWSLRTLPVMGIPGSGKYSLQPIYIDDFADILVDAGSAEGNSTLAALGEERYSYIDLLRLIKTKLNLKTPLLPLPNAVAWFGAKMIGMFLNDVLLTWAEIKGLQQETLWEDAAPLGKKKLSEWLDENKEALGISYHNELNRRRK
ncbi:MAG: SDR family oxidoreductase [Bacteroidales bacterium]